MASIHKNPQSPYWYMAVRDNQGKQYIKSTKIRHTPDAPTDSERKLKAAENKREAQNKANKFEEIIRGDDEVRLARMQLQDMIKRSAHKNLAFASVKAYLTNWLNSAEVRKSEGTVKRYQGTISCFLEYLDEKAERPIEDVSTHDIESFMDARLKEGLSESTVSTDIKTLNIPFSKALREGTIAFNPVAATDKPNAQKETRNPFSREQLDAIFSTAEGEMKTLCILGYFTGQRLRDVAQLKWENIDYDKHQIRLRPQKTQRKKRDVIIPMAPQLEEYLLGLHAPDKNGMPIMPTLANKATSGAHGLSETFKQILNKAGIEQESIKAAGKKGRTFNRYTFHSFRHTFISDLEAAGMPEKARMAIAGHSNEATHSIYTHIKPERIMQCLDRLPKLKI